MNALLGVLLALAVAAPLTSAQPAEPCTVTNCLQPGCVCASTDIPFNFAPAEVPQMVMLTFDDAINTINIEFYRQLYNYISPGNQCKIGVTYYVTHEYCDYSLVHEVYIQGHEIAVHSITHKSDTSYWLNLSYDEWFKEMDGMRTIASLNARVPLTEITGDRAPFLQPGGDNQFQALYDGGFLWDCSLPTQLNNPPLWPYTLDYKSIQDCEIPPCPTESYPGFWLIPMVDFTGGNGESCSMVDQCQPAANTPAEAFNLLRANFDRHYSGNRAPFGLFVHAAWFQVNSSNFEGYKMFLDYLGQLPDVFILNTKQVVDWFKQPTKLADIASFAPWQCPVRTSNCASKRNCHYTADKTPFNSERYMMSCETCPPYYPWLGNELGANPWTAAAI